MICKGSISHFSVPTIHFGRRHSRHDQVLRSRAELARAALPFGLDRLGAPSARGSPSILFPLDVALPVPPRYPTRRYLDLSRVLQARVRTATALQYRKNRVFPPSMGLVSQLSLFAKLQRPTHTDIDAIEFLNGAHQAVETSLRIMFSKEAVNHALGRISKSPATKTLRQLLAPACFDMKFQGLKTLKSTMLSMELNELEIKSLHLGGATFERLTLAEVKQQELEDLHNVHCSIEAVFLHVNQRIKSAPMPTRLQGITDIGSIVIGEHDHTILVERMRLNVEIETTETVTTAFFKRPKPECVTTD